MKKVTSTRREFLTKSVVASAGLVLSAKAFASVGSIHVPGPNDKIRMGFIGIGNRGSQLLALFMQEPSCEIAALCDIYKPYLMRDRGAVDPRYLKSMPGQVPA